MFSRCAMPFCAFLSMGEGVPSPALLDRLKKSYRYEIEAQDIDFRRKVSLSSLTNFVLIALAHASSSRSCRVSPLPDCLLYLPPKLKITGIGAGTFTSVFPT